uniref:Uncharacterized protein n=1 Tax=Tanacetum cinerariifolium TaxID=118510 RepID=A0A699IHE3_TANCI|nr:hypothetical protein [Tanacetum cinerariifolium]
MMDADCELAARLQEEERGELSIEEKSRLFVELIDKRKKHFARLRAEKIRSKLRTKAQKGIKSEEVSSKRAADKLEQEDTKRQMIEEENESAKLKRCLEIIPKDDYVTIEATPLSSKSPTIVDYKIYKEGKESFFKIISADDNIWKYQQGTVKVLHWKLFDSCGVYCVATQNMMYYLLVEKMYLFTRNFLLQMWNDVRLQVDYDVEMTYDHLRLIKRQINEGYVPE